LLVTTTPALIYPVDDIGYETVQQYQVAYISKGKKSKNHHMSVNSNSAASQQKNEKTVSLKIFSVIAGVIDNFFLFILVINLNFRISGRISFQKIERPE
jgi:hypothetical protein